ncbi:DNA repair protein RecN [Candidatus Methylospira mobilis]|uniref:DNA repair protein RecN n=1 Tax=Candidatus Methylospira mobilis TaxID=1808979 RepID=A0A5Q0BFH5_9GAMM|nr:DNA repair protein RecN [Candidatus Methylospira mobilis]QFY42613.1 DNA repair protein RecN [Candidatus Methylospira mobilis]WNV04270.1 DNA repair protein RecN [Candidatus Methylospira mobilis]
MLSNLRINDLAVVEKLDLDFEQGLTVLTGETGAGKSILLTALALASGERADAGFIRTGAARSEIELECLLLDALPARMWLDENDLLDPDNPEICLIRRSVSQDGRSRAFVNGRSVTLQSLQALSTHLIEIHGQHAHLRLLQAQEQQRLLDEYCGNQSLLKQLASLHQRWQAAQRELERLLRALQESGARVSLLRHQIEELEQHEIESLDYDLLSAEHALQANVEKILMVGQEQLDALYDDDTHSASALLVRGGQALRELAQLAAGFEETVGLIDEAQIAVKEVGHTLARLLEKLDADPARLSWLDEKLGVLHRLARKYQTQPQALREQLAEFRQELQALAPGDEKQAELEALTVRLLSEYQATAAKLTARRTDGARRLSKTISGFIRELGMPQGQFVIQVQAEADAAPKASGCDTIEFLVSANPGLPPRPLAKVASGGELSRISLAIQVAAIDVKTTPTLIFDEVDSGIGGGVAEIVGQKLRALAAGRQIFCVTHLHQVAVQGHHHLRVEKKTRSGQTQTQVKKLTEKERVDEIARMLGGVKITAQTLAHAEEMLTVAAEGNG